MKRTYIDFGIDLGTTNSTVSVINGTDAKEIPNAGGSVYTPSAVWINKRGQLKVGIEAKERALGDDWENADIEFKLRMGRGEAGRKHFVRSDSSMLPEELSAEVLKQLKTDVRTNMGEELRCAVITVPAAFENSQINATSRAAELAGFSSAPILLEPVAASLAYGFQSQSDNVYWLVYDFGGGTFDAAVMRIRDGLIQVVNHDGDNFLGGKLIDWDIVEKRLFPALVAKYNLPDLKRGNPRWKGMIGKLKMESELAKIQVCRTRQASEIYIENLCVDDDGKSVDFVYQLTPEDIEELTRPHVEQSLALCRKTLAAEGVSGESLDRILMVGGSTLNPWVRDAVQAELGGKLEFGIDPITVVSRGAAIFASIQPMPGNVEAEALPNGTWSIEIVHEPVGNTPDPDLGGRVLAPDGESLEGYTIQLRDKKTDWTSGRILLGASGAFMTELYAEAQRRCEYEIELCTPTGTRIPTSPGQVSYTIGVVPEKPPAAKTIGVGLANGSMRAYIPKGAKLPFRDTLDHFTTISLRAGSAEDELHIPLLEGEHRRATRNHGIGKLVISGKDIPRDLPSGSPIEITVSQDTSQAIKVEVFISSLDEEFVAVFEGNMDADTLPELREAMTREGERLAAAREKGGATAAIRSQPTLERIDGLVEAVETLSERAENDSDAVAELDRRIRELAAAVDEVEDAAEWPALLDRAGESLKDTQRVVEEYGEATDRSRLRGLEQNYEVAVEMGNPDVLKQAADELDGLWVEVLDRQAGWHVGRFEWYVEQLDTMTDKQQAERIITQGRRAISNDDLEALKAANRQLRSMLPREAQEAANDPRIGHIMTRD
ncbi:MAG: Hsp70 family protein [Planctomycetota bacterium]|nr:Hsp70 family protein [Planctomycetota bacterium]